MLINGYFCFDVQISIFSDATYDLNIKQRNMCIYVFTINSLENRATTTTRDQHLFR